MREEPRDWRDLALCAGELNFGQDPAASIRICRTPCPVWRQCEEWRKSEGDNFVGVAAGREWTGKRALGRPTRRSRFDFADYQHLRSQGLDDDQIAERFGIQRDSLRKSLRLRGAA